MNIRLLSFLIGLPGTFWCLWQAVIALLGLLKQPARIPGSDREVRFAVLIPARNEAGVIEGSVRSVLAQSCPEPMRDVWVLANGCSDGTEAAAEQAGAHVLACPPAHSKGEVLRYAFAAEELRAYDAYVILDADNRMQPGFLAAARDGIAAGYRVMQACRPPMNPHESWVAGGTGLFFRIMDRFYHRGRFALGLSCSLNGTGIVLTREAALKIPWEVSSLTEDLEYTGLCALAGERIVHLEEARVWDAQPAGLKESMIQRRRWFSGTLQCFRLHAKGLLRRHSLQAIDILMVYSGWIAQVTGIVSGLLTALPLAEGVFSGTFSLCCAVFAGAVAWCLVSFFAALVLRLDRALSRKDIGTILLFPLFLMSWFVCNLWALVTPAPAWEQRRPSGYGKTVGKT